MKCPLCHSTQIGRIGRERFYCHQCCHEWNEKAKEIQIFRILEDGTVEHLSIRPKLATA